MSITDKLRKWIKSLYTPNSAELKLEGLSIADRIDEEYQKAIRELNSLADASVLLPVDADGVPIRIGDVMESLRKGSKPRPNPNHRFEVDAIHYHAYGEGCSITEASYPTIHYYPSECRHHHASTVERVLQDMVVDWDCAPDGEDKADVLKEYAAKLRLADGKEQ